MCSNIFYRNIIVTNCISMQISTNDNKVSIVLIDHDILLISFLVSFKLKYIS